MSICSSSLVGIESWEKEPCKRACWRSWRRSCFSLKSFYHHSLSLPANPPTLRFRCCFLRHCFFRSRIVFVISVSSMATKMKGIYKSFKYISQIFVVKEKEMEIGCPTDVKHVAHIGWDGQSGTAPSWMNEFKSAPDFSSSIGGPMDSGSMALSTWSSQDFEQSMGRHSELFKDIPPTDLPNVPKKHKRKKKTSTSSPKSSSSRSSRVAKSKAKHREIETANLQV